MLLFMASRAQLVEEVILPALDRNEIVISDRFVLANIAYQGFGGRLDVEQIATVAEVATAGVAPDLTFVLDVDWETAQQRLASTPDRMEARGAEYFERVRTGFLSYSKQFPDQFTMIDARSSAESIHDRIVSVASAHLSRLA